jgi:hypothetical protein
VYDDKREVRTGDETRDNITKSINEVRKEIPRNTQAINDYQEHILQNLPASFADLLN